MRHAWRVTGTVERPGLETRTHEFVVLTSMVPPPAPMREAAEAAALRVLAPMGVPRPHERKMVEANVDQTIRVTINELVSVGPVMDSSA